MGARFVNIDRETPMLLPPDLGDWVARDDLVRFIIDAVETCDLSAAKVNRRGTGDAQYPPSMMLALLIYCYANRIFSSRQVERATYEQVSVRYLCANTHPDHDTVASFRRENLALLESCFVAVLQLAKQLKAFGQLGTVSVDGTKLGARASRQSNRRGNELEEEIATLQGEIAALLTEAERADAQDGSKPTKLAEALQDKQTRQAALQEAKKQLEARQRASAAQRAQRAKGLEPEDDNWPEAPQGPAEAGGSSNARKNQPMSARDAGQTINLVDPQSRLMCDAHGHYQQAYNAQLVVEAGERRSQLILGVRLTNEGNDRRALAEDLQSVPAAFRQQISHVVADTGYDNADLIGAVERDLGVMVLCPPQRKQAPQGQNYRVHPVRRRRQAQAQAMRERLQQPHLQAIYRRRSASVEPVFGVLKNVLGFRRFRLFGLVKSQIELTLLAIAYNLRRLAQMAAAGALEPAGV